MKNEYNSHLRPFCIKTQEKWESLNFPIFLCDSLGIRIFFFISLIINLFKEISDNPPPNSQRAICFILQQPFKLIVRKGKKNIRI